MTTDSVPGAGSGAARSGRGDPGRSGDTDPGLFAGPVVAGSGDGVDVGPWLVGDTVQEDGTSRTGAGEGIDTDPGGAVVQPGVNHDLESLAAVERTRAELASPAFVAGLSAFVMGLGQFYNGQYRAARVFFSGQICLLLYLWDYLTGGDVSTTVSAWTSPFAYSIFVLLLALGGMVLWLFNIYDAYTTARFCRMIYDRTLPSLDDDEEELLAAHLHSSTFGASGSARGSNRKLAFGALAVLVYTIAIFSMGSYFSGTADRSLEDLRSKIARNRRDAFSHLQLGELLLADGRLGEAAREFRAVTEFSSEPAWNCAAYTNLSRIYKRMGDDERAERMLDLAARAASSSGKPPSAAGVSPGRDGKIVVADRSPGDGRAAGDSTGADGAGTGGVPTVTRSVDTTHGPGRPEPSSGGVVSPSRAGPSMMRDGGRSEGGAALAGQVAFTAEKALADFEAGDADGALGTIAAFEAAHPSKKVSRLSGLKARILFALGRKQEAAEQVKVALRDDPVNADALRIAVELALSGEGPFRLDDAVDRCRRAGAFDAGLAAKTGRLYWKAGRLDDAYELVSRALLHSPADPGLLELAFLVARDRGNESQARQAALALVEAGGRKPEVYEFLVRNARKRGDSAEALKYARVLSVLQPGKPSWLILQAEILEGEKRWKEALEAYRNALTVGSSDPKVYRRMARAAVEARSWELGMKYLEEALESRPRDTALLKSLASLQRTAGDDDGAMATYRRALAVDPDDLETRYLAGALSFEQGDPKAALDNLSTVYRVTPSYRETAYLYGRCCEALDKIGAAVEAYGRVSETSANFEDARGRVYKLRTSGRAGSAGDEPARSGTDATEGGTGPGAGFHGTGAIPLVTRAANRVGGARQGGDAASAATKASVAGSGGRSAGDAAAVPGSGALVPPDVPPVPVERYADFLKNAELAFRDGRNREALEYYEKVLALVPGHFRSLFQKGVILDELGRQREAVAVLEKAKKVNPKDKELLLRLGDLYADLDDYGKAIEEFESAVRLDPKDLAARYNLGCLYEKQKRYDKAEEQYKAMAWFYPEYVKAYEFLGNLYFVQGKYEKALENFDKLLAVDENDVTVRYKAALTLLQLQRFGRAKRELLFLSQTIEPNHPLASAVHEMLGKLR